MANHATLIIAKCDHNGNTLLTYSGGLVYADETKVVARCTWTLRDSHDLGPFALTSDDIVIETFFRHEWFNVFAIYQCTGQFKGWYCNITMPTDIHDGRIEWHDLALDLLVLPNGEMIELDRDEFDAMMLDQDMRGRANKAMDKLRSWVREKQEPFSL